MLPDTSEPICHIPHPFGRPREMEITQKVYALALQIDVGLLCAEKEIITEDILCPTHDLDDFKGGMVENYVCNQLVAGGHGCYYWTGDHGYEVDFLAQLDGAIIPIEVKAAEHTQAKSLNAYRKMYQPTYAIKSCQGRTSA